MFLYLGASKSTRHIYPYLELRHNNPGSAIPLDSIRGDALRCILCEKTVRMFDAYQFKLSTALQYLEVSREKSLEELRKIQDYLLLCIFCEGLRLYETAMPLDDLLNAIRKLRHFYCVE